MSHNSIMKTNNNFFYKTELLYYLNWSYSKQGFDLVYEIFSFQSVPWNVEKIWFISIQSCIGQTSQAAVFG